MKLPVFLLAGSLVANAALLAIARFTAEMRALATEANARLTPLLGGARGLEAYRLNTSWLQQLNPPPPRPTAPAPKN